MSAVWDAFRRLHEENSKRPDAFWTYKLRANDWAVLEVVSIDQWWADAEVVDCSRREFIGRVMQIERTTGFIMRADRELCDKIKIGSKITIEMTHVSKYGRRQAKMVKVEG